MDKIKSLRSTFIKYLLPCLVLSIIGGALIESLSIYLQNWYRAKYEVVYSYSEMVSLISESGKAPDNIWIYYIFFYARIVLVPLWAAACLWFTASAFYRREIKKPVDTLTKASEKILGDDLDFKVESDSENELGKLCGSFEEMRKNLYDSNYKLWKSLEERKRLNSAFSHDLRTPITVLKGYMELIEQFDGKLSPEKQADILSKMSGQIERLGNYTEKMSSLHKLEDIIPDVNGITFGKICDQLEENGRLLCGGDIFYFAAEGDSDTMVYTDMELVMQVFLNLVSNALRYTESRVECTATVSEEEMEIIISDDGKGFSDEAIRKAWQPFYRAGNDNDKEHFGLGLYICKLLCRKNGGDIVIENNENGGGKVTAKFSVKKSENQINN